MVSTIRFKRVFRSRPVGSTDSAMGYGVHDALVQRGIAEFVCSAVPAAAVTTPQIDSDPQETERRSRRKHKEN